jgi:hypothetical protein
VIDFLTTLQEDQLHMEDNDSQPTVERLGLIVDRKFTERDTRRLETRLKKAKLCHAACFEDIDYRPVAASSAR